LKPIKIKRAIELSKLEIELQDVLFDIKKYEGIVNSSKVSNSAKDLSKIKLKRLIDKKQHISDLIIETMLLSN
jgi:hypothetical protein